MGARRPSTPLLLGGLVLALLAGIFGGGLEDMARFGLLGVGALLGIAGLFLGPRDPREIQPPSGEARELPPPKAATPGPPEGSDTARQPGPAPASDAIAPGAEDTPPRALETPPLDAELDDLPEDIDTLVGAPSLDWGVDSNPDLFLGGADTSNQADEITAPSAGAQAPLARKLQEAETALARREEALRETQGEVHTLESQVEELEAQLKEQGQALFEARFKEKKAREEAISLQDETRDTLRNQGKKALEDAKARWEEERQALQERQRTLEGRISQLEASKQGLESQLAGATAGADEGRRALLGEMEKLRDQITRLEAQTQEKTQTIDRLRAESQGLREAMEALEAKGAAEAASIAADRAALEAGRASLQREVEARSREVSQLKSRLKGNRSDGGDPRGALLETLEGAGVPALFVGEEGLIAGVSAPLAELLQAQEGDILGLDIWSFTTDILAQVSPDDEALKAQQAALLEGVDTPLFDPIPLHDGGLLHRWVHPLPGGAGQMELFAVAPGAQGLILTPELEGAIDALKEAAGLAPQPSSITTLEALGRQLSEMGALLPDSEGALEVRARLSTAKALVRSLTGVVPAGAGDTAATAELARRILPHLERALGPRA